MARARKAQVEVSLFPFLSILACVIGILVLILCSVIISQIDPQGVEEIKQANEANLEKQKQLEALEVQVLELNEKLQEVKELETKKVDFKEKIRKLKADISKKKKEHGTRVAKNSNVSDLNKELALKLKQKETLEASLQEKLKLHDLLVAAINQEKERLHSKLKIEQTGSGFLSDSTPTYVECNDQGINIIGDSNLQIPRPAIAANKDFKKILSEVAQNKKKVFVFLLRPSYTSVHNYNFLKSLCDRHGARSAKIPLTSNAPISLGGS